MKTLTLILIITMIFIITGCSINPGVTTTTNKDEINWDKINAAVDKYSGPLETQETVNRLMDKIYGLEVQISRDVFRSKGITTESLTEKYGQQFDSVLILILAENNVPVEVWDSLLRLAILFKYDEMTTILTNMVSAMEERIFAKNAKRYPITKGYLGKLYPGWPTLEIAEGISRGFEIHSENVDNLTRYIFHKIKQVRNEYPNFVFAFYGPENVNTFLYAAKYTINLKKNGTSYYPEPIDMTLSEKDREFWIKSHLTKYRQLIRGRIQS